MLALINSSSYVEATLSDNLEGGVDLFASNCSSYRTQWCCIEVDKRTTQLSTTKIRWQLIITIVTEEIVSKMVNILFEITGIDRAGNRAPVLRYAFSL